MKINDVSVDRILEAIVRVLQSKQEIKLDEGFTIDVMTIMLDVGAGRNRKVVNISTDRLQKKSVLSIPYDDDGMCCAKAILFAIAHLDNDRQSINSLRDRRRPALLNRAKKLHQDAGVPYGPCTYTEIAKFEDYLDVQIVVISSENLNKVIFYVF